MEPILAPPAALIAVAFAAYFAGYAIGRRQGKREGFMEGVRYAPLEMRRQTWERGSCFICGQAAVEERKDAASSRPAPDCEPQ